MRRGLCRIGGPCPTCVICNYLIAVLFEIHRAATVTLILLVKQVVNGQSHRCALDTAQLEGIRKVEVAHEIAIYHGAGLAAIFLCIAAEVGVGHILFAHELALQRCREALVFVTEHIAEDEIG